MVITDISDCKVDRLDDSLSALPNGEDARSSSSFSWIGPPHARVGQKTVTLNTGGCACFCVTEHESWALHAAHTRPALDRTTDSPRACVYNCINAAFILSHNACFRLGTCTHNTTSIECRDVCICFKEIEVYFNHTHANMFKPCSTIDRQSHKTHWRLQTDTSPKTPVRTDPGLLVRISGVVSTDFRGTSTDYRGCASGFPGITCTYSRGSRVRLGCR